MTDTTAQPAAPKPGWYADPDIAGQYRWWTGRDWAEHRQPVQPVQPTPASALPAQPTLVVLAREKKKVNHGLHAVLTLLTFGLWLPVWLIVAISA